MNFKEALTICYTAREHDEGSLVDVHGAAETLAEHVLNLLKRVDTEHTHPVAGELGSYLYTSEIYRLLGTDAPKR